MLETAFYLSALSLICAGFAIGYRVGRDIERRKTADIRIALRTVVDVADTSPFSPVAHVVEHVVPSARSLTQEAGHA